MARGRGGAAHACGLEPVSRPRGDLVRPDGPGARPLCLRGRRGRRRARRWPLGPAARCALGGRGVTAIKARADVRDRPEADGDLVTWAAGTQLLARAVSLILYLRERDEPVTVSEIAGALQIPLNSAYRLVRTLELGGLADRSHRPYVSLGLRFMDLGLAKQRQVTRELAPVAQPVLESLTADTGETSLLLMPTGARPISKRFARAATALPTTSSTPAPARLPRPSPAAADRSLLRSAWPARPADSPTSDSRH